MTKRIIDLEVTAAERLSERYVLLRLLCPEGVLETQPGQFAEVRINGSTTTFLRRPISICYMSDDTRELWLLVALVGEGTKRLAQLKQGDSLNCVLPLGNGFTVDASENVLLVGGGVGVAPLLYTGAQLRRQGGMPTFLLGARTAADLLLLNEFRKYGKVFVTTEDGSEGVRGFVTNHPVLSSHNFDRILCCGPTPMMKAVARQARKHGVTCEVSLENLMACGLGACLCCVEKTTEGNLCVCKDGPVFNINRLLWQD